MAYIHTYIRREAGKVIAETGGCSCLWLFDFFTVSKWMVTEWSSKGEAHACGSMTSYPRAVHARMKNHAERMKHAGAERMKHGHEQDLLFSSAVSLMTSPSP